MSEDRGALILRRAVPWLVAAIIVLIYLPAMQGEFIADDHVYISANSDLQAASLKTPWRFFLERTNPFEWLPLRDLSLRIDWAVFGEQTWGYHLHNVLLYLLACFVCWWCSRELLRLFQPKQAQLGIVAALTALLFALHPAHVESVAWISGRKDLLSGVFVLLALGAWARACRNGYDRRSQVVALLSLAAALLSKSTVIPIIAVMAGLSLCQACWQSAAGRAAVSAVLLTAIRRSLPVWVVAGLIFWIHLQVGADTGVKLSPESTPASAFDGYLQRAMLILGTQIRLLLLPVELGVFHDVYAPVRLALHWGMAVLFMVGVVWGAWACLARRSLAGFCLLFIFLMLLPYLQLIPFGSWSLASERYLFLSIMALSLLLSQSLMRLKWRAIKVALLLALAIAGGGASAMRAADWQSKELLLKPTPAANNDYGYLHYTSVVLLPVERIYETPRSFSEADFAAAAAVADQMRQPDAKSLAQQYIDAHHLVWQAVLSGAIEAAVPALATLQWRIGQVEKTGDYFQDIPHLLYLKQMRKRLFQLYDVLGQLSPGHPYVAYNAGMLLYQMNRFDEAIEHLRLAGDHPGLELAARSNALNRLGLSHQWLDQEEAAIESFKKALALSSSEWLAAYNLARLYQAQKAPAAYRQALSELRERGERAGLGSERLAQLIVDLEQP